MKKKVRYAAGTLSAFGVMPALGLAAPPALANGPACSARVVDTGANGMHGAINFSRDIGCVNNVNGFVPGSHEVLSMRIRFYRNNAQLGPTHYTHDGIYGTPIGSSTTWRYQPAHQTGIGKVCEAIVSSGTAHHPRYGAVCQSTGYTG